MSYGYEDQSESYQSYDSYGGGDRRGYEDESFQESSESYSGGGYGGDGLPPPPRVPYPWRPRWDDRERRYCFYHEETGETVWSTEEVEMRVRGGGGRGREEIYEQTDETSYSSGGYGGGYGGGDRGYENEQSYQSEEVIDESSRRRGGGNGLMYAAAGAAGGAFAMYEGEKIHRDYEDDKYRVEGDVDRFGERVEDDVEYAPENAAGWVGEKVGDVERFGDNVEGSYDEGRFEGRYEGGDY